MIAAISDLMCEWDKRGLRHEAILIHPHNWPHFLRLVNREYPKTCFMPYMILPGDTLLGDVLTLDSSVPLDEIRLR